jgi:hypothetical protein
MTRPLLSLELMLTSAMRHTRRRTFFTRAQIDDNAELSGGSGPQISRCLARRMVNDAEMLRWSA